VTTELENLFLPQNKNTGVTVDENSKITPISKKEILDVHADKWDTMSLSELYQQKSIMEERLFAVLSFCDNPDVLNQIKMGMNRLAAIIESKEEITLI